MSIGKIIDGKAFVCGHYAAASPLAHGGMKTNAGSDRCSGVEAQLAINSDRVACGGSSYIDYGAAKNADNLFNALSGS